MAARTRPTELGGSFGPTASSPRSQQNSASSSGDEVAIILVDMGQLIPIGTYGTRSEAEIVEGLQSRVATWRSAPSVGAASTGSRRLDASAFLHS
jgi:hypothetical protein